MTTASLPLRAVLTGDVVDSEAMRAAGGRTIGELMREVVAAARVTFPAAGLSDVDVFRGDSWQLLVEAPEQALALTLFLRAWFRARASVRPPYADMRIAIGLGTVSHLNPARVSESEGEAFVASGLTLDQLSAGKPYRGARLALVGGEARLGSAGPAVAALLDALVVGWTPKQAWALCGKWKGLTQTEIGESFGEAFGEPITQVVVGQHLRAAAADAVDQALAWFTQTLSAEYSI